MIEWFCAEWVLVWSGYVQNPVNPRFRADLRFDSREVNYERKSTPAERECFFLWWSRGESEPRFCAGILLM